jgi:hypothetical protein
MALAITITDSATMLGESYASVVPDAWAVPLI